MRRPVGGMRFRVAATCVRPSVRFVLVAPRLAEYEMDADGSTYERPHVLLMVETSIAYGRGILAWITRWLRRHRGWSLYLEQHELGAAPPAWLADWRGDGVICRVTDPEVAAVDPLPSFCTSAYESLRGTSQERRLQSARAPVALR